MKTLGLVLGGSISVVSADVGKAASPGPLSMPQSRASTASAARSVAVPLASSGRLATGTALPSGAGNMLGRLPIAGMAPRGGGV
ncbi:PPE family protein, SVP subgroup [Mycobacterium simulans]|uniref:PPE family protein, SVP subgroup n=1 Tax=Mycobacterium simulans TaxID=627089 RepID=UPI00163EF45B|nr:hypothetical protein [Mycobacterium simulans]